MPRLLQVFTLVLLALAVRPAHGFSLLGPLSANPGGEAWQTVELGYNLGADVGTPKNLTEEYRWNTPIITYGFENAFINYFGTEGIAAIEAAIAVYNDLPDLSTLNQDLREYPLVDPVTGAVTTFRNSRRVNYTAQALNLLDMKSYTMGALAEQLGLAAPERWTWTLRARTQVGPLPVTNYFTIMRNFDPVTYMPSRYVNGSRYTYSIVELDNPRRNFPLESPADPESLLYSYSSVANTIDGDFLGLTLGSFFTYLTRDDIGGLRYIYDRENLNYESFAPGTQITAADFSSLTLLTNQDLFSFSSFTFTNPPAAVLAAFPDLVILTNSSFFTTEVQVAGFTVTNVRPPWGDPFTSNFVFAPVLQTNAAIRFLYSFANVLTNYSSPVTIVRTELSGFEKEPWSTPQNPIYRTNIVETVVNFPSGGILIVPTNVGTINFAGPGVTNVIGITNIIISTNLVDNGLLRPVQISESYVFTNVVFAIFPTVVQAAPASVLRGGIGEITFRRLTNAVITGTNFLHTNVYTATYLTNNGAIITNTFSIVQTQPDIVFGAADLGVVGVSPVGISRGVNFTSNAGINSSLTNQGGPGNIFGGANIIFNKVGPGLIQQRPPVVATEESAYDQFGETFVWGSFDGSTNPPVVFPKDITGGPSPGTNNVTLEELDLLIRGGLAP